jgi:hypothetical protein
MEGKPCGILGKRMGNIVKNSWLEGTHLRHLDIDAEDFLERLDGPEFKPNVDMVGKDLIYHLLCKVVLCSDCCALWG